jgi:D-threonate/D-erythronate kinase
VKKGAAAGDGIADERETVATDARIVVLADDSSGALECAAEFAPLGTRVDLMPPPDWKPAQGPQVQVLLMESRVLSAERAAERLARFAGAAWQEGVWGIYHKSDSTLRGNVGAELSAIVKTTGQRLLYTPANPRRGRTCRSGKLLIFGVPIQRTAFAADPFFPARTDDILGVLRPQMTVPLRYATPADAKGPSSGGIPPAVILPRDCENDQELVAHAHRLLAQPRWIAAGSSGLANALSTVIAASRRNEPVEPAVLPLPALMVCGSLHPLSRALAARAEAKGVPLLPLDAGREDTQRAWEEACRHRGIGLLRTAAPEGPVSREESALQCATLAQAAAVICSVRQPVTVVIFGGDTASAVLRGMGIRTLDSLGEIAEGFALSMTSLQGRDLWVVTRPGGFSAGSAEEWMGMFGEPNG